MGIDIGTDGAPPDEGNLVRPYVFMRYGPRWHNLGARPFSRPFDAVYDRLRLSAEDRGLAALYRTAFMMGCKAAARAGVTSHALVQRAQEEIYKDMAQAQGRAQADQTKSNAMPPKLRGLLEGKAWQFSLLHDTKKDSPLLTYLRERESEMYDGLHIAPVPEDVLYKIPYELWAQEPLLDARCAEAERLIYNRGPAKAEEYYSRNPAMAAFMAVAENRRRVAEMFAFSHLAQHYNPALPHTMAIARRVVEMAARDNHVIAMLSEEPERFCEAEAGYATYLEWAFENRKRVLTVMDKEGLRDIAFRLVDDVRAISAGGAPGPVPVPKQAPAP